MSNSILIPKKSVVPGKIPLTTDLQNGEICINHADKKLFAKNPSTGSIQEIGGGGGGGSSNRLISNDLTAVLELQDNGSFTVIDSAITTTVAFSSTTGRTITFPDNTGTVALLTDLSGDLTVDSLAFNTAATETDAIGKMFWNATEGSTQLGLAGGNLQLQVGSMLVAYVRNGEATTLNKGEVVYLDSASGNRATVKRASNGGDPTSAKTMGIVAESIASNQVGFIVTQGVLAGLSLGSPYVEGDSIYLGSTPGTFTRVKPTQPEHIVFIGVVERANAGNGQIYIKPQNGFELEELHDVLISSVTANDFLVYDSSGLWKNRKPTTSDISGISDYVTSITSGVTGSTQLSNMIQITQAGYNAITASADTLYVIVG